MAEETKHPTDANGQPVVFGKRYWAWTDDGQFAGLARYSEATKADPIMLWVNGLSYFPEQFSVTLPAEVPPFPGAAAAPPHPVQEKSP